MTNAELLKKVKDALSISGNYQDATLNVYIEEVKEYLKSAGLATETIQGIKCVGIICRGVTDLWAYGVGEGKLSSYFMQRVSQLVLDEKKVIADKPQEPGSDSGLTEEQLAKINTILIYGDGSNVLTDSGEYVNFETTVKEIIDKSGGVGESGKDGKDGFSPIAKVTKTGEITTVSITDKNGTTTAKIYDGANGKDGVDGSNGVGIAKIEKTATVGLIDTYTIFYTNNTTTTFTVKNGKDGANGSGGSESVDLSNYYNKSEVDSKIDGLDLGDKNVQADWNTADKASDSYIRNKPTIPKAYDDTALAERVASLENSAFSGNYEDLQNKPTIPTKVSQLENDKGYLTQSDIETASTHTHANKAVLDGITVEKVSEWNNKSNFDGDYNSLINKPSIPVVTNDLTDSLKAQYDDAVKKAHSHTNKSALDTITSAKIKSWDSKSEFTGSYEDLTDKPTIPSVEGLATETYVDNAVSSVPVYDDAEIKASVADLQTNKASKTDIADFQTQAQVESLVSSEIAKIVANAPSNFDTLKEIADWIATHENSASAMNTAITANTQAIANCVKKTDITISATDIGEGSTLANGALYFVYE